MFAREEAIHIEASPEAIYEYVSDFGRHPEWANQKLVMHQRPDGRFESDMAMGPLKAHTVLHVEVAERPTRFVFMADDDFSGPHRWHFNISPDSGGSKVRYGFERMHNRFPFTILQPLLLFPAIGHPGLIKGLAGIKRHVEMRSSSARAASRALKEN